MYFNACRYVLLRLFSCLDDVDVEDADLDWGAKEVVQSLPEESSAVSNPFDDLPYRKEEISVQFVEDSTISQTRDSIVDVTKRPRTSS